MNTNQPCKLDTIQCSPATRRDFIRLFAMGTVGFSVTGCDVDGNIDPRMIGPAAAAAAAGSWLASQTGNEDLAKILAWTTVALAALTVLSQYQADQRQIEAMRRKSQKIKESGRQYNNRYIAAKVPPPSKSQTRHYTPKGAELVQKKQKPAASTHVMVYDIQTDQIHNSQAYEVANPKTGGTMQYAGIKSTYCGF